MLPPLEVILERIRNSTLLAPVDCTNLDCNAVLDVRDNDAQFEADWLRAQKDIEQRWDATDVATESKRLVSEIRREAFLAVSGATSQHEIATYISDDFNLIGRSVALGCQDPVIELLWDSYSEKSIPPRSASDS